MVATRKADSAAISEAAGLIRAGGLVAFGTETVYGLGGDATNGEAVARIFAAKGRPAFNPLICHLPDAESALRLGKPTRLAEDLAQSFWPGPVTLVLDRADSCPVDELATSGLASIALRVPAAAPARELLTEASVPVAAPSANRSGRISPTRAGHVEEELGGSEHLALILDCGPSEGGLESTVIDARGEAPAVLRPGTVTAAMIRDEAGVEATVPGPGTAGEGGGGDPEMPVSPGQLESHYAPATPLLLDRNEAGKDGVWIGFGPAPASPCRKAFNLSARGDLIEAAANLYAVMREADAVGAVSISVAPIPHEGLGAAINDRLARAAGAVGTPDGSIGA